MAGKLKKKSATREWIESIIIAVVLATFLRTFFFQLYKIPTTSMVPTLKPGDKIFVSRLSYGPKIPFTEMRIRGFSKPKRGEVIVFIPPNERKKAYVKRLIGLEGDVIILKDGNIYVNGKEVVDPRIASNYYYNQGDYAQVGKTITVPKGHYFFLGDNSISSMDSRYWGFADEKDIVGKAIFIWWPLKRVDMIE
jgi:signal peptidase I